MGVPSDTGIGREVGRRDALSPRRKAQAPGQANRGGERARKVSRMSGHRTILLCDTAANVEKRIIPGSVPRFERGKENAHGSIRPASGPLASSKCIALPFRGCSNNRANTL